MVVKGSSEYLMVNINAFLSIYFTDIFCGKLMLYILSKCNTVNSFIFLNVSIFCPADVEVNTISKSIRWWSEKSLPWFSFLIKFSWCSVMIRSRVFCCLCVGNLMWFCRPRLSNTSWNLLVSGLSGLFMGILKSPNISNLPFSFILFSRRSRKSIAKACTLEFGGL